MQFGSQYKTKCYPQILHKCKVLRQANELGLHLCYSCCLWKQLHMRSIPWDLVGFLNTSTSNKSWTLLIACIFLKVISNMTHLTKYWLECVYVSTRYIILSSFPITIHEFYLGLSKKKNVHLLCSKDFMDCRIIRVFKFSSIKVVCFTFTFLNNNNNKPIMMML